MDQKGSGAHLAEPVGHPLYRRVRSVGGAIGHRLYCDYVQPERLAEYDALLRCAIGQGYVTMTLSAYAESVAVRTPTLPERVLLLRHDIDTDVPRARRMWEVERRHGLVGSYFFRRSTWHSEFIRQLADAGCEVGYHYEELATAIKQRGAATAEQARALRGVARAQFVASVVRLRRETGLRLDVFAAHGDFANRAVGVCNVELLADVALREQIGVRLEAYDIEDDLGARSADGYKHWGWWPADPIDALRRCEPVVEVLLHPRSWGGAPLANARADLDRLREGCIYRIRCARRRGGSRPKASPAPNGTTSH